jgi:hypothetical protein
MKSLSNEEIKSLQEKDDNYNNIKKIINTYSSASEYPNFKILINELKQIATGNKNPKQERYDFVPISSKKKKCMYCYRHSTISSHSISNSQLDHFSPKKIVYRIINRNILVILSALFRVIENKKDIISDSIYFAKISNTLASTFPGFCGSDNQNHDCSLFSNIDGHHGLNNKEHFIWETLYRIISWKICKYEVEVQLNNILNDLSKKYPFFIKFWNELLSVNKQISIQKSYFKEQKKICMNNITHLKHELNLLKQMHEQKEINLIKNRFFLHIETIKKPQFIGMNYFCDHNQSRKNWFEKHSIKNHFACGIFFSKNTYYSFVISDIDDQYCIETPLLQFIKPILLGYDSENTFVHPDNKEEIKNYMLDFSNNTKNG